jgi:molybdopterin-containing oxidoreductase family iron-sulfur binding subunit
MSASPDLESLRRRLAGLRGERLWRTLEELAGSSEIEAHVLAEFGDVGAASGLDRRAWLKTMGATLLAGLAAACDRGQVVRDGALLSRPRGSAERALGAPLFYATTIERAGAGFGVLVRTHDGRPNKVDGNPIHPASLGATDPQVEAEILGFYDPDRSRAPTEHGEERNWTAARRAMAELRAELLAKRGRGAHLLTPPVLSPTIERLLAAVRAALPEFTWHTHAAIGPEARHAGALRALGRPADLVHDLAAADVVVSLGGDLFAEEPGHVRHARDFIDRRRQGRPARALAVEHRPSLFGARADERVAVRPRDVAGFARALAGALGIVAGAGEPHPAAARWAARLNEAGAAGIVAVGGEQPAAVHALAFAINARLGAFGRTLRGIEPIAARGETLAALAEAIAAGRVERLIVLGSNPAYDAPGDLGFAALLGRVPVSVHLGLTRDETAARCRWHLPAAHAFEGFGDLRAQDGTAGLRQPVVAASRGLSPERALAALAGLPGDERALLAETWRARLDEAGLARALEDGVIEGTAAPALDLALRPDWDAGPGLAAPVGPIDVAFAPDPSLWDGRHANNGRLQELPKPFTKQVWGNAALIAPATAAELGVSTGDVVAVAAAGRTLEAPVLVEPGCAPGAVTLPLGYGRTRAGALGDGVGFDAYPLRRAASPWLLGGSLRKLSRRAELTRTQEHHAIEAREILKRVPPGGAVPPLPPQPSLYPAWPYPGHAWGMAIDLDACIGCNACAAACQAENNVPVVGPEEAARGREMHWLRVDRYDSGGAAAPRTAFQPVPCMHCERAPCEVVCPVNATVHSAEGLNDMVYSRCVGTRTCSNNCPYKVRRFNFLDYSSGERAADPDAMNPQVTVRARGVMEKCTYCVQRIGAARVAARLDGRRVQDGEIATACQQACPTQAIVFGDVNDPESAVARAKRSARNYALLGELGTAPRTTYLARVEAEEGS